MRTFHYTVCIAVFTFLLLPSIQAQQNENKTTSKPTIEPMVLAVAADFSQTKNMSLEWAIGEIVTETVHRDPNLYYTQGMHQPLLSVIPVTTSISFSPFHDSAIRVYPNPVSANLKIDLSPSLLGNVEANLIDVNGNILYQMNENQQDTFIEIDMSRLPAGMYWFSVRQRATAQQEVFKVIRAGH